MGSRSRLGLATGLRYQELLGDLEKGNWQTLTKSEFQGVYLEMSSVDKIELDGFSDASERAYGSVVYICG